jgi:hypothetical protein
MTQLTAETLLNIGFRDVATWAKVNKGDGLSYSFDGANAAADRALLDVRNALYAFVEGDTVKYVGKTARSIRKRFVGYCTPGKSQQTNWRCHQHIKSLLEKGDAIRILVFTPISQLRYGDFEIDLAAGLEESLIAAFAPPWNGRDGTRLITEEAEREATDEPEPSPANESSLTQSPPFSKEMSIGTERAPSAHDHTTFQIRLGPTYYHQGFINPGTEASRHLGKHGDPVIVYLGGKSDTRQSIAWRTPTALLVWSATIDRLRNGSSGTSGLARLSRRRSTTLSTYCCFHRADA